MALQDGLLSYWKLDEASGNTLDSKGSVTGTVVSATQNQPGKINTSYFFDGDNDYVNFGNNLDFERTDTRSFQFWMNQPATPTVHRAFMGKTNAGTHVGFDMGIRGDIANDPLEFELRGSSTFLVARAVPNTAWDGNYHHIVMTYAGTSLVSGVKIYQDGVSLTVTDPGTDLSQNITNTGNLLLGIFIEALLISDFLGNIDEVGVWNRVLAQSEVTELYNGGAGLPYPLSYLWNIALV